MIPGIDVSVYQGSPDWSAIHAHGVEFAGIKASEGLSFDDPRFPYNWQHAKAAGVRRIAYHFFHADLNGKLQADWFHNYVRESGKFGPGDCAMLDIETTNGVDTRTLVANAEAFVEQFLEHTVCGLYIYTGPWFWDGVLGNPRSAILGKCPLWIATWGAAPGHISNWPSGPAIWQWSSEQRVPGIVGLVDADRFLGTQKEYDLLARWGGRR